MNFVENVSNCRYVLLQRRFGVTGEVVSDAEFCFDTARKPERNGFSKKANVVPPRRELCLNLKG